MLQYSVAINDKGEPFPAESLIMALLLLQQKMIDWLISKLIRSIRDIIFMTMRLIHIMQRYELYIRIPKNQAFKDPRPS
jgi:CO dehydrogenase/acetyl-CoA synthase beta subunit